VPFVVALRNGADGIGADALVHRVADVHNLFSSTLGNFHVTNPLYYQICVFLYSLMPRRPLGLHYSTIGFNHVGKIAVLNELKEQMRTSGQVFDFSPGHRGTVAIGFTFDACSYHLKIIRDRPTASYKWGPFVGVDKVLEKYRVVHEINRAGSMLDNIIYYHLKLDRAMFGEALLAELVAQAPGSVQIEGDAVLMRHLIAQLKIVPVPIALEHADDAAMREVMAGLGHCVRNNAATNIFNHDLDARNYGVGRYGRVFLFDYDAVERLTDVKVRTNLDREPGEEDVPGWFFEDGIVFLPEELEHGLQLRRYDARRAFRSAAADLMTVAYWHDVQDRLQRGEVIALRLYPDDCRL
jgi:isocitrate dehydrogenase kinase/phosphatase